MKRLLCLLSASALVAGGIGCQKAATDTTTPTAQQGAVDPASSDLTLVSLSVPNMF